MFLSGFLITTTMQRKQYKFGAMCLVEVFKKLLFWSTAPYQTKLYLFYLANNVLVKERNSGNFKVIIPHKILICSILLNSWHFYLQCARTLWGFYIFICFIYSVIPDPEIATKILDILRLWKDHHTMGRSMTHRVLSSIPSQILYFFNAHPM